VKSQLTPGKSMLVGGAWHEARSRRQRLISFFI
jgi:hypothetical protein